MSENLPLFDWGCCRLLTYWVLRIIKNLPVLWKKGDIYSGNKSGIRSWIAKKYQSTKN
jgi:hypothetical protein